MKITLHNLPHNKSEVFELKYGGVSFKHGDETIHIAFDDKNGVSLLTNDGTFIKLASKKEPKPKENLSGRLRKISDILRGL